MYASIKLHSLGGPSKLRSSALNSEAASALKLLNREKSRQTASTGSSNELLLHLLSDPDEEDADMGEDNNNCTEADFKIWRLLPHLQHLPDALLQKLPLSAIFQLNSALAKEDKTKSKLSVNSRLASNAKRLADSPSDVREGKDNRKDILHSARFLGGASCPNIALWLEARRVLGDKGVLPIGNYDLDSVGCGGCVTPRGWQEIHNPSSQELKLKLFYLPNVAGSGLSAKKVNLDTGDEALSIGESLKEIADMDGYRSALNTVREAMASALPWNRSVSALVGFMMNTNYLQSDLGGNQRRAQILTEFTDHVFGRNALNYENGHPFLTTDDLAQVWSNWKGKRSALFLGKYNEKPGGRPKFSICKRWNSGVCPDQSKKECKTTWGTTLKHVCNKYVAPNKMCEKEHTRADHK